MATEYLVVEDDDRYSLASQVTEHLTQGWVCQGGVGVALKVWAEDTRKGTETYHERIYVQAMAR